jgi:hypothetical protein
VLETHQGNTACDWKLLINCKAFGGSSFKERAIGCGGCIIISMNIHLETRGGVLCLLLESVDKWCLLIGVRSFPLLTSRSKNPYLSYKLCDVCMFKFKLRFGFWGRRCPKMTWFDLVRVVLCPLFWESASPWEFANVGVDIWKFWISNLDMTFKSFSNTINNCDIWNDILKKLMDIEKKSNIHPTMKFTLHIENLLYESLFFK